MRIGNISKDFSYTPTHNPISFSFLLSLISARVNLNFWTSLPPEGSMKLGEQMQAGTMAADGCQQTVQDNLSGELMQLWAFRYMQNFIEPESKCLLQKKHEMENMMKIM